MNQPRPSQDPNFKQQLDYKKNLDFPETEYEDRYRRIRAAMAAHGLDALLLTTEKNLRYFSGFKTGMWLTGGEWPYVTLMPADESREPAVILPEFMEGTARSSSWMSDIRWPQRGPSFGDVLVTIVETIKDKGLSSGKIGTELGDKVHLPFSLNQFRYLQEHLPDVQFVDGEDAVYDVRKIKSPREVDALTAAFEITWNAYQEGFNAVKPGMTELELYRIVSGAMCREGSEPNFFFALTGAASGHCLADGLPSEYEFEKGQTFMLDCGACVKGYWADFARLCVLGAPSAYQEKWIQAIIEANLAAAEAIRPGGHVGETIRSVDAVLEKHGLAQYRLWDLVGHGLGMGLHEPPYLTEMSYGTTGKDHFKPGMVINIEASIADAGAWHRGRYAVEDSYLVTEDGKRRLTDAPQEPWIA